MNKDSGRKIWSQKEKTFQQDENERKRDFLQERFFKWFPPGQAALWMKLLVEKYTYSSILIRCQIQYIKAT